MILAIAALLFMVAFYLVIHTVLDVFLPSRTPLIDQISFYEEAWNRAYHDGGAAEASAGHLRSIERTVGSLFFEKRGLLELMDTMLTRAGLAMNAGRFVSLHTVAMVFMGILALWLWGVAAAAMTLVLVSVLPLAYLSYLRKKRSDKVEAQLAETISMLTASLRAGYGLTQAVDTVSRELPDPIGLELKKVVTETQLGMPLELAMQKLALAHNRAGIDWLVMVVRVQKEVGGNLAEVLDNLAHTLRERDRIYRQVKVLTAEGRLSAVILYLLPLVVSGLIYLLSPDYLSALVRTLPGLGMLSAAVALMVVGAVWMAKIVNIKV